MNPPTTADTIDGPHDLDENRRCPHCGKTYPAIQIEADGKDFLSIRCGSFVLAGNPRTMLPRVMVELGEAWQRIHCLRAENASSRNTTKALCDAIASPSDDAPDSVDRQAVAAAAARAVAAAYDKAWLNAYAETETARLASFKALHPKQEANCSTLAAEYNATRQATRDHQAAAESAGGMLYDACEWAFAWLTNTNAIAPEELAAKLIAAMVAGGGDEQSLIDSLNGLASQVDAEATEALVEAHKDKEAQ